MRHKAVFEERRAPRLYRPRVDKINFVSDELEKLKPFGGLRALS
jgi:hypothetical protein